MATYKITYVSEGHRREKELKAFTLKRDGQWTNFVESNGQVVWSIPTSQVKEVERIGEDSGPMVS